MAEQAESGFGRTQAEFHEMVPFPYADSPWTEPPAVESFPAASPDFPGRKLAGQQAAASTVRPARAVFTQRYTYDGELGFTPERDSDTSESGRNPGDATQDSGKDSARELANQQLFEHLLASETQKAEERGRGKGMEAGLVLGREEATRQLQTERDRLVAQAAALVESFAANQQNWLHHFEREAAQLALAIAARILRREAQMDPLLLTGAVRVALGQLAATTAVRLVVPDQDRSLWEEALDRMPGLATRPQIAGDPRMELGECRMETDLGFADLGLWPQLKATERGFFERRGERSHNPGEGSSQDLGPDTAEDSLVVEEKAHAR